MNIRPVCFTCSSMARKCSRTANTPAPRRVASCAVRVGKEPSSADDFVFARRRLAVGGSQGSIRRFWGSISSQIQILPDESIPDTIKEQRNPVEELSWHGLQEG